MDGARLGVVQDAEAEQERQRGGEPELEQRPGDRNAGNGGRGGADGFAPAGIGFGNERFQIG
jgi:hypothetical protein